MSRVLHMYGLWNSLGFIIWTKNDWIILCTNMILSFIAKNWFIFVSSERSWQNVTFWCNKYFTFSRCLLHFTYFMNIWPNPIWIIHDQEIDPYWLSHLPSVLVCTILMYYIFACCCTASDLLYRQCLQLDAGSVGHFNYFPNMHHFWTENYQSFFVKAMINSLSKLLSILAMSYKSLTFLGTVALRWW